MANVNPEQLQTVNIQLRKHVRGSEEHFIKGEHVSLQRLKEQMLLVNPQGQMMTYLRKEIPPYPCPVEFSVPDVAHVTGEAAFKAILELEQFRPGAGEFSWWGLKINKEDIRAAERHFMENDTAHFPNSEQEQELSMQEQFLDKFTTSPAFEDKSRYGNYRFTFPLSELMKWYKEQNCGGAEAVLRVHETVTYRQEIMYTVLIHSPEYNEHFREYPLLKESEWVRYQDGKIIWKAQAICETHWYRFVSGERIMEPDVIRMYSSSPPPMDEDGEEEDDDDFGEFGGYCCDVSSSFGLSEWDTPTVFDQSYEKGTSPSDLYHTLRQSVGQPGKDVVVVEEKIAKDQELSNPEPLVSKTDVALDCGNRKIKASTVILNGPLFSDPQGELSVVSVTGKHSTPELQEYDLGGKDEHINKPTTDQVGHCLTNGPITFCNGKELEQLRVSSTNSTESLLGSTAEVSSSETDKASTAVASNGSQQSQEDTFLERTVSEARDTQAGEGVTESQAESQSNLAGEHQRHEIMENEEINAPQRSQTGGPSGTSLCETQIQRDSEDLGEVPDTSVEPVVENILVSDAQFNENTDNETPVSPVVNGLLVVPGKMEEDFEKVSLPVVDPTVGIVHDVEADPVMREGKRVQVGSSVESDEDFGDFRDATQGFPDVSQTESVSQEGFADFVTALSDCSSHDEFADADTLKDLKEEEELPAEDKDDVDDDDHDNNNHEIICLNLPPSDSFADFSSAPFGGLAGATGESWAEFGQHEECEAQQESWAAFDEEQQSCSATVPSTDSFKTDNMLLGLSHKLQHLFESTFPLDMAPKDLDVPTLQAVLEPQDHVEIRESVAMWRHLLDIHSAHGLKVQWVGSRSNKILLDCLGIYNILFTGQNKQPVIVPMFAAGLGMLEPTKDHVNPSSIFSASSPNQRRSALCTQQVVSSLSLEDDGVDPELYELTTAKLESNNTGSNVTDAFTRLMETVEKNSTLNSYGLLGPSGCGKTTLLKCIVGTLKISRGHISVLGKPPAFPGHEVPGRMVGYMPQDIALYNEFTISDTLWFFGRIHGLSSKETRERMKFLIDFLDLPQKSSLVRNLSGGQRRRVSLGAALLQNPRLLILDEPTVGVDPVLRSKIWQHLVEIVKGGQVSVIITTHYIEEARQANMVGLMRNGRLLAESKPEAIMKQHNAATLESAFLQLCEDSDQGGSQDSSQGPVRSNSLSPDSLKDDCREPILGKQISGTSDIPKLKVDWKVRAQHIIPKCRNITALTIKTMVRMRRNPG
ncbi:ABC transporter G family member 23-like isoform X2, partial [Clarias magur]